MNSLLCLLWILFWCTILFKTKPDKPDKFVYTQEEDEIDDTILAMGMAVPIINQQTNSTNM